MKRLIFLFTVLMLPLMAEGPAPLPAEFIALGVGYNDSLSKHVIPDVAYGHVMAQPGAVAVYAVTGVEVTGVSRHPLQAQTVMTEDVCAITRTLGEYVVLGMCGGGGVAATGTNVGGALNGGGFLGYRFGKSGHFNVVGKLDAVKTALNKTVPALSLNLLYGFGK